MLMAQAGLDAPSALARLRAYSFSVGRTITEVADDVVARHLRLHPDGVWSDAATGNPSYGDTPSDDPVDSSSRDDEENPS